jgi:hypothetical protein
VAVEQLAQEYAGQPVVFLEYNVDAPPETRISRFWASFNGQFASLPLTMVDSGNQIYDGYLSGIKSVYQGMVDYAMTRTPKADLSASWARVGNKVHFSVHLTNQSGTTLSSSNGATLHAIVYEASQIQYTQRFVRTAISTPISTLVSGASADYVLQTGDLTGVEWSKLHYIVLADYRPNPSGEKYDMLQAAVAVSTGPNYWLYLPIARH